MTAYVNGVMAASTPQSVPMPKPAVGLVVGRNDPSSDLSAGMIDELRIYGRARTAAEIAAAASRGK